MVSVWVWFRFEGRVSPSPELPAAAAAVTGEEVLLRCRPVAVWVLRQNRCVLCCRTGQLKKKKKVGLGSAVVPGRVQVRSSLTRFKRPISQSRSGQVQVDLTRGEEA